MGILSEVIATRALDRSHREGEDRHRSELVTLYIKENPEKFRIEGAELPQELYRPEYRLTVDEPEDVMLMERIFDRLYEPGRVLQTIQAIRFLDSEPALAAINARVRASGVNVRSVALDERRAAEGTSTPRERSEPGREEALAPKARKRGNFAEGTSSGGDRQHLVPSKQPDAADSAVLPERGARGASRAKSEASTEKGTK
jgi:hypothetical protein